MRALLKTLAWAVSVLAVPLAAHPAAAPERRAIILDTDANGDYDDPVTLVLAASSPELDLLGVVVTSPHPEAAALSVAKMLEILGRDDVGVYLGESAMSSEPQLAYWSQFPKRRYGLTPQLPKWAAGFPHRPQAQSGLAFYLERIRERPGEISVVTGGPLSTIGKALRGLKDEGRSALPGTLVKEILFSGGDFDTAEWNVYEDVAAARIVFGSGARIRQFGGEGTGKAHLTHDLRARLWNARTPATWALYDLYGFWKAGWDPRSPFVPILYDSSPVVFAIAGERWCRFEDVAVEIDDSGRLVRSPRGATIRSRVENDGAAIAAWIVGRLSSGTEPARNHLRSALRYGASLPEAARAEIESVLGSLDGAAPAAVPAARSALEALSSRLAALGASAEPARRHVEMAKGFLFGAERDASWHDPYVPAWIPVVIAADTVYTAVTKKELLALAGLAAALVLFVLWRRGRRRGRTA